MSERLIGRDGAGKLGLNGREGGFIPHVRVICALRPLALVALGLLLAAPVADAAFPGSNGKILFVSDRDDPGNFDLYTAGPDGTGVTRITTDPALDRFARWSPDGRRIVFQRHFGPGSHTWYLINPDGSGQTATTLPANTVSPAWSPDGEKLVYGRNGAPGGLWTSNPDGSSPALLGNFEGECEARPPHHLHNSWSPAGSEIALGMCTFGFIARVNADGTGFQFLTTGDLDFFPDWSPDASRITWSNDAQIKVMNRDGTGMTAALASGDHPVWSPDGTKIAWEAGGGISVMNPDGTGQGPLVGNATLADWQPLPVNGYPRPRSATPLRVSLVPAYERCTAANRTHGAPLAFASCNPPAQSSSALTVGTPDANGPAANSVGSVRLSWMGELPIDPGNGDQGDVRIQVSVTDVRNRSDLTDYSGELRVSAARRITDKLNTPHPGGPGPATVRDDTFTFDVPCTPTPATGTGSACSLTTTADTLVPGTVTERVRAVWQLDRVGVYDSGGALFLTQGIFLP